MSATAVSAPKINLNTWNRNLFQLTFPVSLGRWAQISLITCKELSARHGLLLSYYQDMVNVGYVLGTYRSTIAIHLCPAWDLRSIFVRHGIPKELFTDKGPQFSPKEFSKLIRLPVQIRHITRSPHFPQSKSGL